MSRLASFRQLAWQSTSRSLVSDPRLSKELATGLLGLLVASTALSIWHQAETTVTVLAVLVYLVMAGLILRGLAVDAYRAERTRGLGAANRVTLVRGLLVALLAGALLDPARLATGHVLPALAWLALALDGVDGWVARRTHTESDFGARFDMEVDALFILVLCLALMTLDKAGPWILAIGMMRYAFLLAGLRLAWLRAPLPASRRRKAVCVWQVVALLIALLPSADATVATWLAATALAALVYSFSVDVFWLHCHAR